MVEPFLVVRQPWGQFLIMPPVVDPAQRDFLREHGKLGGIITHQCLDHRDGWRVVGVVGRDRQRILDPLPPLCGESCGGGVQVRLQFRLTDRAILRQAAQQFLVTGRYPHQAHETFRARIQSEDTRCAAPQRIQGAQAVFVRQRQIDGVERIADHMAMLVDAIYARGRGVDMLPGRAFQPGGQDILSLVVEGHLVLRQERRHLARRNLHPRQREDAWILGMLRPLS